MSNNSFKKYASEQFVEEKIAALGNNDGLLYEAKSYTDEKVAAEVTARDAAIATAKTEVKNELLNGAGEAYDTLQELGALIDGNETAIKVLETVASGKADKVHSHTVSDISDLQTHLDSVLTEKLEPINNSIANIPTIQLITWEADD